MVWKQDLAKLKAQLREEPAPPPPKKAVPVAPQAPSRSIEEEDALFLAMMGRQAPRPAAPAPAVRAGAPEAPALPEAPEPPQSFSEALAGLKGMRPISADPLLQAAVQERPRPEPPRVEAAPAPSPVPEPEPPSAPTAEPRPQAAAPLRIHLAAGMAVEVDGTLDLRGHSLQDALERLKDRAADAQYLRWRSLLVHLGPEPGPHEGLQELLGRGGLPGVARYAQAPVPMGGPQAWILYFHS